MGIAIANFACKTKRAEVIVFCKVKCGFWEDSSTNFDDFTDTLTFYEANLGFKSFFEKIQNDRLSLKDDEIIESAQVNDKIKLFHFGKNLLHFKGYKHDDFGVIFVSRTDWRLEDYSLLKHPNLSDDQVNYLVELCKVDFEVRRDAFMKLPE